MVRETIRAKVALVGDDKIGKTKLLRAFMRHGTASSWTNDYEMTIEIDLQIVSINIPDTEYCVELQVLDFGGNSLFSADPNIRRKYMQITDHVIAAYDISRRTTFDSLKSVWLQEFKSTHNTKNNNLGTTSSGVVLGLQADLSQYSTVNPMEAIKLAKEYNMVAMKCSSKENQDIDLPFNYIAQQVFLRHKDQK